MRRGRRTVLVTGATLALATAGIGPALGLASHHHHGKHVALRSTSRGDVLATEQGRVMYMFMKDSKDVSRCSGSCTQEWPRVKSHGKPRAEDGVRQHRLGKIAHRQITYHGHPLYFFDGDTSPGQANGEGIYSFGGYWYVVTAKGNAG